MQRRPGRPLGEFSESLLQAARAGPATMLQLAHRAQVGYDVARFKVPALARAGVLVALTTKRPRLYALPDPVAADAAACVDLAAAWWPAVRANEVQAIETSIEPDAQPVAQPVAPCYVRHP